MFIAKNKDLIILAKNTREELEQALEFMVYTSIEETETEYELYGGEYLTSEEIAEQEQERIQALYMTRSDFFDGFIMAFGLGQAELRTIVEQILNSINITDVEIKVALNNYDNALNFYRKHALFTLLNNVEIPISEDITLIFTSDIWDKFFDTKDYKELQKAIKVKPEPEPVDDDSDTDTDTDTDTDNIEEMENL
jgi:hypothetical protein